MRDRNDSVYESYILVEKLMEENVRKRKFENNEQACDAIVASLLLSDEEREAALKELFKKTHRYAEFSAALNDEESRVLLLRAIVALCQKYVKPLYLPRLPALSGLVKNYTNIAEGASVDQAGLSRAVSTILRDSFNHDCYLGQHLLAMNDNERKLFHFLAEILGGVRFEVDSKYSTFSGNDMEELFTEFVGDAPIAVKIKADTLNEKNRADYDALLRCENKLVLTLVEGSGWQPEDVKFLKKALSTRKSVTLCCDMVPHSEGYVDGYLSNKLICQITNVKVTVEDSVSLWRSHGGSWRDVANKFYKQMAKFANRKCELSSNGVVFLPVKQKESIHSLFARKFSRHHEDSHHVEHKHKHRA